jgi:hypothetical protein
MGQGFGFIAGAGASSVGVFAVAGGEGRKFEAVSAEGKEGFAAASGGVSLFEAEVADIEAGSGS